jgi:hypothetical protein
LRDGSTYFGRIIGPAGGGIGTFASDAAGASGSSRLTPTFAARSCTVETIRGTGMT